MHCFKVAQIHIHMRPSQKKFHHKLFLRPKSKNTAVESAELKTF
jgi:hypothetical protein